MDQDTKQPKMSKTSQLKERLETVLPSGYSCNVRYIHSPPRPCDPLFSALPGQAPERTKLANHFLTVSIDPASLSPSGDTSRREPGKDVISFAIEALVYTSRRLTTIFVSKVDSTPFVPRVKPSPIKSTVTAFLQWLAHEERRKRPDRKLVISLFARAQAQYLFPGSSDDKTKHILDDRQLIKWWARTLDPIIPDSTSNSDGEVEYQGYMTVPGYDRNELRALMPPATSQADGKPRWMAGNPLPDLAQTRGIPEHAPPRCLLPRFPDDPKARFMQDLDDEIGIAQESKVTVSPSKKKSGKWKSVSDLNRFWEAMEFRQECSSGRVVGFLWLVISPKCSNDSLSLDQDSTAINADSQESSASTNSALDLDLLTSSEASQPTTSKSPTKRRKRKLLTGQIVPRQPRLKGGSSTISNLSDMQLDAQSTDGIVVSKEGYDKAMATLLNLDFSNLQTAIRSTSKWIAEVGGIANVDGDFATRIVGNGKAETTAAPSAINGSSAVNDLGGMIRKKRKAGDGAGPGVSQDNKREEDPAVNVLAAGTIRKKPKAQT